MTTPDTSGSTRDRNRTRTEMVAATARLIQETGRTWFSVEEVCRAAGYTRGAFYSSFAKMQDLLLAVHELQNQQLLERAGAAWPATDGSGGIAYDDDPAALSLHVGSLPVDQARIALHAGLVARALEDPELATALDAQVERLRAGLEPLLLALLAQARRRPTIDAATFTRAVMAAQAGAAAQFVAAADPHAIRALVVAAVVGQLTEPF